MASAAPRKVLIAMDGSRHSNFAFDYFVNHVWREGDEVLLVHAADHGSLTSAPLFSTDPMFVSKLLNEEETEIKNLLERLKGKLASSGVAGRAVRYSANTPGEAVVKAAREAGVDLIVTGTRGLGMLRRTILGSVSQYILHHADVPVLICREK